jgi:hypothetical protein
MFKILGVLVIMLCLVGCDSAGPLTAPEPEGKCAVQTIHLEAWLHGEPVNAWPIGAIPTIKATLLGAAATEIPGNCGYDGHALWSLDDIAARGCRVHGNSRSLQIEIKCGSPGGDLRVRFQCQGIDILGEATFSVVG